MSHRFSPRVAASQTDAAPFGRAPLVLWGGGVALDIVSLVGGGALAKVAFVDVALGCVVAVTTLVVRPVPIVGDAGFERRTAFVRGLLQLGALALFWVSLWARRDVFLDARPAVTSLLPALCAVACLVAARLVALPVVARAPVFQRR